MKKFFIILTTFLLLLIPLNIKAVSSEEVNYKVKKYHIDSEIEIAGSLKVRALIEVSGKYNDYNNTIMYENSDIKLEGHSKIYDGTSIIIERIGKLKDKADISSLSDNSFLEKNLVLFEKVTKANSGDKEKYTVADLEGGKKITLYNETINNTTTFFLEYTITNLVVEHNDSAEFYYNFIKKFDTEIEDLKIITRLPYAPEKLFKVWGHGSLDAEIKMDKDLGIVISEAKDYPENTPLDNRILFDKELFMININQNKKSNIDAIDKIVEIETKKTEEANQKRAFARTMVYGLLIVDGTYLLGMAVFFTIILRKHDIEYKSKFKNKYNKEFIDEYDVEYISYIMSKDINNDAFSASIMNLIYKKNIEVKELPSKRKNKDYEFTKLNEENISKEEKIIMDLLFNEAGSGEKAKMSDFRILANKTSIDCKNKVYDTFMLWKQDIKTNALKKGFWEEKGTVKIKYMIYGILGIILSIFTFIYSFLIAGLIVIVLSIAFIIYIRTFRKRSKKGNEHYHKWKAFKNFLIDFGKLDLKELPKIALWERYLVYATLFGIADKVSRDMDAKLKSMTDTSFKSKIHFNHVTRHITKRINKSVDTSISSVAIAKSKDSSSS